MNILKQIVIGSLFVASLYCGVVFLYMGEYVMAVVMFIITIVAFIEGRKIIARLVNYQIRNKTGK